MAYLAVERWTYLPFNSVGQFWETMPAAMLFTTITANARTLFDAIRCIHLELVFDYRNGLNGVVIISPPQSGVLTGYFCIGTCIRRVNGATLQIHAVSASHFRVSVLALLRHGVSGISVR